MNKEELIKDIENNLSSYDIAKKYNKSQGSISYWIKKYKIKTKFNKIGQKKLNCLDPQKNKINLEYDWNWKEIQKDHNVGMSWDELTKKYKICRVTLQKAKNQKLVQFRNHKESMNFIHEIGKVDYSPYRTESFRRKMSKFGGFKDKASGRVKGSYYIKKDDSKVWLQGSWEIKFATFLDKKNIQWDRNKIGYRYIFEGKDRKYFPDFFLKEFNLYVEVKGREKEMDYEKWKQFPLKLLIVKRNDISNLEKWYNNYLRPNGVTGNTRS